jgi:predicted methyltransferase
MRSAGKAQVRSSLNLNKSFMQATVSDHGVLFENNYRVTWDLIEEIAGEDRRVFSLADRKLTQVQVFSEATGWLRTLCATAGAPTTLISGIPMHRIKDTEPMADTRAKIAALRAPRGRILDTATGLGYTAILAAKTATQVVTIELDPAAIELARMNPWSSDLFGEKITQVVGDSFEEVLALDPGSFIGVVHDPPTLSLGGELYSEEFYRRLYRVLRRGGRLFHYIGDPRSNLGKRVYPGVMKRLAAAGFKKVKIEESAHGVCADS